MGTRPMTKIKLRAAWAVLKDGRYAVIAEPGNSDEVNHSIISEVLEFVTAPASGFVTFEVEIPGPERVEVEGE